MREKTAGCRRGDGVHVPQMQTSTPSPSNVDGDGDGGDATCTSACGRLSRRRRPNWLLTGPYLIWRRSGSSCPRSHCTRLGRQRCGSACSTHEQTPAERAKSGWWVRRPGGRWVVRVSVDQEELDAAKAALGFTVPLVIALNSPAPAPAAPRCACHCWTSYRTRRHPWIPPSIPCCL